MTDGTFPSQPVHSGPRPLEDIVFVSFRGLKMSSERPRGDPRVQGLGLYISQHLGPMAGFEEQDLPPLSLPGHRRLGRLPVDEVC